MTIKEANNRLEKIDNDIEYWLSEKEDIISRIGVGAVDPTKEVVAGGKRTDRYLEHMINDKPIVEIDEILDGLYSKKRRLELYIENELHRLGKYREVEQLIIYYKEQCTEKYTWLQISQKVYYSPAQCRNIYKKWKRERDV